MGISLINWEISLSTMGISLTDWEISLSTMGISLTSGESLICTQSNINNTCYFFVIPCFKEQALCN